MASIANVIHDLTLEQKAGLVSGEDFWYTKAVKDAALPRMMLTDGPSGLRKQSEDADALGLGQSVPAVSFPVSALTACTFDRQALFELGRNLGVAAHANNVGVLLGPGVNIKRNPLAGRNFEYFSEDPYLAGELGAQYVKGVQSENVGVSVKHFAANNRENQRFTNSANMDQRTLREIYLTAFERIVKQAQPASVMCAYNKINGITSSENKYLLTDILRDEWNFSGVVLSDWGAVSDHVAALKAGLDLEMPGKGDLSTNEIVTAVRSGALDEATLDRAVNRILTMIMTYLPENSAADYYDKDQQHQFARKLASESMVLLKNDHAILPLKPKEKVLLVGELAQKPRFQGGGSSHVAPYKVTTLTMAARQIDNAVTYLPGYHLVDDQVDAKLEKAVLEAAKDADKIVVVVGLPEQMESEGFDKTRNTLPMNQNHLLDTLIAQGLDVIVVLQNGAPIAMPWVNRVSAILETYLAGEAVGEATFDVLTGKVNPSGKLAETFPIRLQDTPNYLTFDRNADDENYREGIFVGYRYYDTKHVAALFPFGYGLSYTTFIYQNLAVKVGVDTVTVSFTIKNSGEVAGQEVAQIYVSNQTSPIEKPAKELKQFIKVSLEPGQQKAVSVELDRRAFSWFNERTNHFQVDNGHYEIIVAASSVEPRLRKTIQLTWAPQPAAPLTENTYLSTLLARDDGADLLKQSGLNTIVDQLTKAGNNQALFDNMPLRALIMMGAKQEQLKQLFKLARA
ncbi:glycoside hydrolase family 3 C-terminal domain-containing protein [Lactobacillus sp. CC-MHH1034]|uniref:beta-glucosidase family protein n=1 Tax=Agrilactobacillus fermenti TaxID=2586909 RepID=UPI001E5FBF71|nr:glycoside hydrolase family 3 C-terminal domain-containing protein [Agrilactobacillus fermenti]MCD2255646.1 glycoside hydrolase family 3 C-terminal domain-containing protein [Agrilactobacillus fermenti]